MNAVYRKILELRVTWLKDILATLEAGQVEAAKEKLKAGIEEEEAKLRDV